MVYTYLESYNVIPQKGTTWGPIAALHQFLEFSTLLVQYPGELKVNLWGYIGII